MNKRIYNDTAALHAVNHKKDFVQLPEQLNKDNKSSDDVLIKYIYAEDPRTGLPRGDMQLFMSVDASPEVKDYIAKNLMQPTSQKPVDSGLSVDEMNALSRHAGESRDSYISRMNEYFTQMREANIAQSKTE